MDSEVLSRCTSQRKWSGSVLMLRKNVAPFLMKNFVHLLDVSCQGIVFTFQEGSRRLLDGSEVPVDLANVTFPCLVQLRLPPTHSSLTTCRDNCFEYSKNLRLQSRKFEKFGFVCLAPERHPRACPSGHFGCKRHVLFLDKLSDFSSLVILTMHGESKRPATSGEKKTARH